MARPQGFNPCSLGARTWALQQALPEAHFLARKTPHQRPSREATHDTTTAAGFQPPAAASNGTADAFAGLASAASGCCCTCVILASAHVAGSSAYDKGPAPERSGRALLGVIAQRKASSRSRLLYTPSKRSVCSLTGAIASHRPNPSSLGISARQLAPAAVGRRLQPAEPFLQATPAICTPRAAGHPAGLPDAWRHRAHPVPLAVSADCGRLVRQERT